MNMHRISIVNVKGGCGKTTMATNLAAYFANKDLKTTIIDYDPQGSIINWLGRREKTRSKIYSIAAYNKNPLTTMSWRLQPPLDTEIVITDTPAGIGKALLNKVVNHSDIILIPVMPSAIDTHAAAHLIEALLIYCKARAKGKRIGIIANRVHPNTISFQALERFIARLDIPLVARFRRLENYVHAIDLGIGIHEFPKRLVSREVEQWNKLASWLVKST